MEELVLFVLAAAASILFGAVVVLAAFLTMALTDKRYSRAELVFLSTLNYFFWWIGLGREVDVNFLVRFALSLSYMAPIFLLWLWTREKSAPAHTKSEGAADTALAVSEKSHAAGLEPIKLTQRGRKMFEPPQLTQTIQTGTSKRRKQAGSQARRRTGAPKTSASNASRAVELGILCASIRYLEEQHGSTLPDDFRKARDAWVKSGNDPSDPHYSKAARLLKKWFESFFRHGPNVLCSIDFSLSDEADNLQISGTSDAEDRVKFAFSTVPKLKSLEIAAIDFRLSASSERIRDGEVMLQSPDLGIYAVFEAGIGDTFRSRKDFARWIGAEGKAIADFFTIQIRDEVIKTGVAIDDEFAETSAEWTSSDMLIEVNPGVGSRAFKRMLAEKVHAERDALQFSAANDSPVVGQIAEQLRRGIKDYMEFIGECREWCRTVGGLALRQMADKPAFAALFGVGVDNSTNAFLIEINQRVVAAVDAHGTLHQLHPFWPFNTGELCIGHEFLMASPVASLGLVRYLPVADSADSNWREAIIEGELELTPSEATLDVAASTFVSLAAELNEKMGGSDDKLAESFTALLKLADNERPFFQDPEIVSAVLMHSEDEEQANRVRLAFLRAFQRTLQRASNEDESEDGGDEGE